MREQPTGARAPSPLPKRRTIHEAVGIITTHLATVRVWTPAQLRQATGLTHYQIKVALNQLVAAGVLMKTGSTQAVRYYFQGKDAADARTD